MKILILVLDMSISGGVERVTSTLGNLLSKNHEVTILSVFGGEFKDFYEIDIKIKRISVLKNKFSLYNGIEKLKIHFEIIMEILKFLNTNYSEYDYILSMFDNLSIYGSISKAKNKIIAVQHGDYFAHNKIIRCIRKIRYRRLKAIVSLTEDNRRKYLSINNKNIKKIENPLPFKVEGFSDLKNKKMIAVGRLVKEKGFENLIEIVEPVLKKYNWTLDIFGEGVLKKELADKIKKYNLEDYVFLKGNTSNIKGEYKQATIYLCSSLTESFSMTLLEAMACGLAVVSYDCPNGPRELIDNEINGILVENQNKTLFLENLVNLVKNQNRIEELGKKAIEKAKEFQGEIILDKWEKLFLDLREKN